MNFAAIAIIIFSASILGIGYPVSKIVTHYYPPIFSLCLRFTAISLVAVFFLKKPKNWSDLKIAHNFALIYNLGFIGGSFLAVKLAENVSSVIIISQAQVPLTALIAYYLFKDKLNLKQILGIVIAITGVIVTVWHPDNSINIYSTLFAFVSCICFAYGNIIFSTQATFKPLELLLWSNILTIIYFLIYSYFFEDWSFLTKDFPKETIINSNIALLINALTATFNTSLWGYLLKKYSVNRVVPYSLLSPIAGVLASILLLDESLTLAIIIGGVITIIGVAIITLENLKQRKIS